MSPHRICLTSSAAPRSRPARVGAVFDGPNLMASAGLVPVMALAERCACMIVSGRV